MHVKRTKEACLKLFFFSWVRELETGISLGNKIEELRNQKKNFPQGFCQKDLAEKKRGVKKRRGMTKTMSCEKGNRAQKTG